MRSLELFAGCGGLALGLCDAGFKPALVVENDSDTVKTLEANRKNKVAHMATWSVSSTDVREVKFASLTRIGLVSGGPPCQPFSIGGKHLGPKDERNMWPEAIRAIREVSPKGFIFENVRGLLRPSFSRYLDYITKQLEFPFITRRRDERWTDHLARLRKHSKCSSARPPLYRVIAKAINTADYGAPQKRYRTIFMGVSSKYETEWSFPKPTHTESSLVWSKYISGTYWKQHNIRPIAQPESETEARILKGLRDSEIKPKGRRWRTVRDALSDLPCPNKRKEPLQGHWQHPGARTYDNHTGSKWDSPAKALKAGDHGVPGGENMVCNRWGNVRYFTIREMARLQCLPDEFVVTGSWKSATRQLGNAVPSIVGKRFGDALLEIVG